MPTDEIQNIDSDLWYNLRAWDELNNVMHYEVEYMTIKNEAGDYMGIVYQSDIYDHDFSKWPPEVDFEQKLKLMYWLRVRDKKGKKIYQSDIVKVEGGDMFIGEAGFSLNGGCPYVFGLNRGCFLDKEGVSFEVIGNVYENPELLLKKG